MIAPAPAFLGPTSWATGLYGLVRSPAYTVRWLDEPATATGVHDYRSRRVVVTVRPR
jgi:hypothetical protein